MTSPFAASLMAGKRALRSLKAEQVIYCTDSFEVTLQAGIGKTTFRIDRPGQIGTRQRSRDFLVMKADLVDPNGERFEPREGHRLKQTIDGVVYVFECLPFGDEPGYRDSDTTSLEWRIHTLLVGRDA